MRFRRAAGSEKWRCRSTEDREAKLEVPRSLSEFGLLYRGKDEEELEESETKPVRLLNVIAYFVVS